MAGVDCSGGGDVDDRGCEVGGVYLGRGTCVSAGVCEGTRSPLHDNHAKNIRASIIAIAQCSVKPSGEVDLDDGTYCCWGVLGCDGKLFDGPDLLDVIAARICWFRVGVGCEVLVAGDAETCG
jgi:hypothetical protein